MPSAEQWRGILTPSGAWFGAGPNALIQLTEQAVDQDGQGFTSGEWNDK